MNCQLPTVLVSGLLATAAALFAGAAPGASREAATPPVPPPPPPTDIRDLSRDALADFEAKNVAGFLSKMEALVALRPDFPRLHVNLAAAYVANNRPEDAAIALNRLADLGLHSPVEKARDFAGVLDRPDFKAAAARLNANLRPVGEGQLAFVLPAMTGIIEGIAWNEATGEYFFGDVHHRSVWVRGREGRLTRFTSDDPALLGVFGLVVDARTGTLWAATTGRPEMRGYTPAHANVAAIADIDLANGKVRRVVPVPVGRQDHVLGDLALTEDGSIFAPDSGAPILWRFAPRTLAPEVFIQSEEFASLQGIVAMPGGRVLIVSDYVNGLLAVDLRTRSFRKLSPPEKTTLVGIDGLALAPDGSLLAVQNGVRPVRVLQLKLDETHDSVTSVTVLESGHITMGDPALGTIAGGEFVFIGNSGWTRFEPPAATADMPRPVPIYHTKLPEPPDAKAPETKAPAR